MKSEGIVSVNARSHGGISVILCKKKVQTGNSVTEESQAHDSAPEEEAVGFDVRSIMYMRFKRILPPGWTKQKIIDVSHKVIMLMSARDGQRVN